MGSVATKDRAITKLHPFSPWVQQGEISVQRAKYEPPKNKILRRQQGRNLKIITSTNSPTHTHKKMFKLELV